MAYGILGRAISLTSAWHGLEQSATGAIKVKAKSGKLTVDADGVDFGSVASTDLSNSADILLRDGSVAMTDDLDVGNNAIVNVADPTNDTDAANKRWVLAAMTGVRDPKDSVRTASTGALPAYTRTSNTLDADANGSLNDAGIGGVSDLAVGDRFLLKNGAAGADNGIYVVDDLGASGPAMPAEPSVPVFAGTLRTVTTEAEWATALTAAVDGDIIEVPAATTITLTAAYTIQKSLEIRGQNRATSVITSAFAVPANGGLISVSGSKAGGAQNNNFYVHTLTITSTSNANDHAPLRFSTLSTTYPNGSTGIRVEDCNINHTENAIVIAGDSWVIKNCTLSYTPSAGAADTSRAIAVYNVSTIGWIESVTINCTTEAQPRVIGILLTASQYDSTPGATRSGGYAGDLIIKDCAQGSGNLRQWLLQEVWKANGLDSAPMPEHGFSLWVDGVTHLTTGGGGASGGSFNLYKAAAGNTLSFFNTLQFINCNIGASAVGKGLVAVDAAGGVGLSVGAPTTFIASGNVIGDAITAPWVTISSTANLISASSTYYTAPDPLLTASAGGSPWAASRSTDADSDDEVNSGLFTFVTEGTLAGAGFLLTTADPITLNTTALTFTQISSSGSYTAGDGLTLTGSEFAVGAGVGISVGVGTVNLDYNDLADAAIDEAADYLTFMDVSDSNAPKKVTVSDFISAIAADGISTLAGQLYVNYDDSTIGLTMSNQLEVKAGGITETHINSTALGNGLTGGSGSTISVSAGDGIDVTGGSVAVNADVGAFAFNAGVLDIADGGVTETHINSTSLGNGLTGGSGTVISVSAGNGIDVSGGSVAVDESYSFDFSGSITRSTDATTIDGLPRLDQVPVLIVESIASEVTDTSLSADGLVDNLTFSPVSGDKVILYVNRVPYFALSGMANGTRDVDMANTAIAWRGLQGGAGFDLDGTEVIVAVYEAFAAASSGGVANHPDIA